MRMYRGLKEPYDPTRGTTDRLFSTDFTDCPYTALRYATGRRGVVLVVDVPDGAARVSEELWIGPKAKRLMFWGRFHDFILAELPAKELRAEVRRKGIVTLGDEDKSLVLGNYIRERLSKGETLSRARAVPG